MAERIGSDDYTGTPLINEFKQFTSWKKTIKGAYEHTTNCFDDLVQVCPPETQPKLKATLINNISRQWLNWFIDERTVPKLLVVGHTNSGKTSFINELLGYRVLPTSDISTASRPVKLQYSETRYAKIVDSKNTPLRHLHLTDSKTVPNEFIILSEEDAQKTDSEVTVAEVGLDNDLLKSGLVLYDVPSYNKANILDLVRRECVEGVLQLMIYIIDGNYGVRLWDQDMLCSLYKLSPHLRIFYVCTKIDLDRLAEEMDQPSSDEEEDGDDTTFATDKMIRTYKALVTFGFFNDKEEMHSNKHFHGVSVREVSMSRDSGSKSGRYFSDFEQMKREFGQLALELVKQRSHYVVRPLYNAQARCCKALLVPSLQKRDDAVTKSTQKIEIFKVELSQVHGLVNGYADIIASEIEAAIAESKPQILKTAREMQFSPIEVRTFVHKDEMKRQLEEQVLNMVIMKLTQKIKEKLAERVKIDVVANMISEQLMAIEPTGLQHISIQPRFDDIKEKIRWQINTHIVTKGFIKHFKFVQKAAQNLLSGSGTTVDANWRESIANDALQKIKAPDITEIVCKELHGKIDEFEKDVEAFLQCVDDLTVIRSVDYSSTGSAPQKLRSLCTHHFRIDALMYNMTYGAVKLHKQNDLLKEGERNSIFHQTKWPKYEGSVTLRIGKRSQNMNKDVAVLVAIQRYFRYPPSARILSVLGLADVELDRHNCVATVVPRMDDDLWTQLFNGELAATFSVKQRLQMAYDIAKTCQVLSETGFPVQDLRITNILIQKSSKPDRWLGVLNTLKPRDNKVPYPDRKLPFHIAPEDYAHEGDKGYRNENDNSNVYAFGIALWLMMLGRYVRPSYAESKETLLAAVQHKKATPNITESLHGILPQESEENSICTLIERCLAHDYYRRPKWDDICDDITRCIDLATSNITASGMKVTRV